MGGAYWESVYCVPEMTDMHCHLRQVRGRIGLFDEPRVLISVFRGSVLCIINPRVRQRALPLKKKMFGYSSLRRNGTGRLSTVDISWSRGIWYDTTSSFISSVVVLRRNYISRRHLLFLTSPPLFLVSLVIFVSCVHIACFIWHGHDDMAYDELISRSWLPLVPGFAYEKYIARPSLHLHLRFVGNI